MSYSLVLRDRAAQDVLEAFFWYHLISPELGERFMEALEHTYTWILANPKGFQIRKSTFRHALLRQFPYRVVYEVEGETVYIYQVRHTSRKPSGKYGP